MAVPLTITTQGYDLKYRGVTASYWQPKNDVGPGGKALGSGGCPDDDTKM